MSECYDLIQGAIGFAGADCRNAGHHFLLGVRAGNGLVNGLADLSDLILSVVDVQRKSQTFCARFDCRWSNRGN